MAPKSIKHYNIKAFLDKSEAEGKEDRQITRAYRSIKFFLEDFMCQPINFSENQEDEFFGRSVKDFVFKFCTF
ncbi:MAG: hypothetical protein Q7J15_07525 [Candidatus Desulfaltia sp.]|nr:hypothetical protein [Candidatus Desulfaltia sp.]